MAENIYNITLPDGTTVPLPAWATDETLRRLVAETSASKKLDEKLLKVLSGIVHETGSIDDILRDLKSTTQRETKKREILDKKTQQSVGRFTKAATRAAKGMGDTSRPLSASLDMMKGSIETLFKDMDSGSTKAGKNLSRYASRTMKMYSAFGKATGIAVSTILGMNAKKFEQFEESQRRMIDSGAAFLESEQSFHDLYKKAIKAGVSYDIFTQLVQQSGTTLRALGDSVSSGQVKFLSLFKDVNEGADKFGDFGLKSADMMQEFAEYVEMERLKGTIGDVSTEIAQKKLKDGFANLMFETTELANLTGIKSKDQRSALRDALKNNHYAVMLGKMTTAQQSAAEQVTKTYGVASASNPMAKLFNDFSTHLVQSGSNVDMALTFLRAQHASGSEADSTALQMISQMDTDGVFAKIKDSGSTNTVEVIQAWIKSKEDREAGTISTGAGVAYRVETMYTYMLLLQKTFGKLNKDTLDKSTGTKGFDTTNKEDIGQKLGESGTIVQTMNDFGIMLAELQEKVLLPLDKTSESLYSLSSAFRMFVDVALSASIKSRFKEYGIPLLAGNDEVMAHLDRIHKINTLGYRRDDIKVEKTGDDEWEVKKAKDAKKAFLDLNELTDKIARGEKLSSKQQQRIDDTSDASLFKSSVEETRHIDEQMRKGISEDSAIIPEKKNKDIKNDSTSQISDSTTPDVTITQTAHEKLITDHQSTTLQNHKSMLSLTEELKITVANMKQVAMDRSNSTRSI